MTTYTAIANTEIDADSPVTTTLMQSMRDNPIATAEGSADAPVVAAGWHPYDMVTVGDGNDGVIYDHAVDGSVTTVTSPTLVDGYEYAFHWDGIVGPLAQNAQISLYLDTDAAWSTAVNLSAGTTGALNGIIHVLMPRIATFAHATRWIQPFSTSADGDVSLTAPVTEDTVSQTVSGVRFLYSGGSSITAGKIKMLRRREYISG